MSDLILEVGKTYKTRKGEKVVINLLNSGVDDIYIFRGTVVGSIRAYRYTQDGRGFAEGPCEDDIVSEDLDPLGMGKLFLINVLPSLPLDTDVNIFTFTQFVMNNADDIAKKPDIANQVIQNLFTAQGAYNHVLRDGESAPDINLSVDMRKLLSITEDVLTAAMNNHPELKIEVGKTYLSRCGEPVTIMVKTQGLSEFRYRDQVGRTYRMDGRFDPTKTTKEDLVSLK